MLANRGSKRDAEAGVVRRTLTARSVFIFAQSTGHRTVGQTVAAAGAFAFYHFVHVMDILHFRMHRALGAYFAAKPAGNAEIFDDFDFHQRLVRAGIQTNRLTTKNTEGTKVHTIVGAGLKPAPTLKTFFYFVVNHCSHQRNSLRPAQRAAGLGRPGAQEKIEHFFDGLLVFGA
jgi:hypothetical protein